MSSAVDFHSQIASIMEVLANAAVAEICKVVDDGYAVVHLEMSRSQKENDFLRRKIKLLELQIARYRAERVRGPEGSGGSRFPGVRLLNRQGRDPLAGPSLQGRTRFLNRGPGAQQSVQKIQPIDLDQDPDQEVVTTTKTESAEPEEEGELLIVKVEGGLETGPANQGAPPDPCISTRGDVGTDTPLTAVLKNPRRHSETEGQGCLTNTSSPHSRQEQTDQVQGDTPKRSSPSQRPLEHQENSQPEDMEQPSCSTFKAAKPSFSHNRASGFPAGSKMPPSSMNRAGPVFNFESSAVGSVSHVAEDKPWSSARAGDDAADEAVSGVRSPYQSLLLVQVHQPAAGDVMCDGNAAYRDHVAKGTVDSQHPWSGIQQADKFSSQDQLYQASDSQKTESGPAQSQQQPCLPYACTFCSRRYAHQCQLRIHERVHTGEKPYQCAQCGKKFGQFCSLKRHQMVHTGERPFPCPHCGKQFSTSTNLKVHQSVHTGEKRFHCSKCGKNFSFLSNLIRHQALHTAK
ncbi:oocyte zinc finger protein XlCOF22-like [Stegastes partitus]|uniref:Oocyte zinc finger protein XlCOF22-like n=1 Tax=Stegastes partitus TaxID=144197 RepID=A0A9Y4NE23_9TELE|nr:PREDICTED: oocyte zinc finger protein XlCOF22-like [Stegastes partitus]